MCLSVFWGIIILSVVLLSSLDEGRSLYHVNIGIPLGLGYIHYSVCLYLGVAFFLVVLLVGQEKGIVCIQ